MTHQKPLMKRPSAMRSTRQDRNGHAPPPALGKSETAIDIFQKLVAAARSADRTMSRLAEWIIGNQTRVASLSISSLASEIGVSETTVFRFCKLLGLSGYKDLRLALAGIEVEIRTQHQRRGRRHDVLALLVLVDRVREVIGLLDQDVRQAQLRRARGGAEAGRPRTDDGDANASFHPLLPRSVGSRPNDPWRLLYQPNLRKSRKKIVGQRLRAATMTGRAG